MIKNLKAVKILDSRKRATVKVRLKTNKGVFYASCPAGASTGKYEAKVLDVAKAIENINKVIAEKIIGMDEKEQSKIDRFLIELDGTKNKQKLGANAILPVSTAVLRAGAKAKGLFLYEYISQIYRGKVSISLPKPCFNIINGGVHAKNGLDIQEFMIIPFYEKFNKNLKIGRRVFNNLKKLLKKKFGRKLPMGDEGGFSPKLESAEQALDFLVQAIGNLRVEIGLDIAANQFNKKQKDKYTVEYYKELVKKYPIIFIEDPFSEQDYKNFERITVELKGVRIIGDDFLTTNIERIKKAKKACNGAIIKPNQIGTVTETLEAVRLAKSYGFKTMVSHRSGETMDDFVADLATGVGSDFIKSGAPSRPERLVKYKRLAKIEKQI